jgi:hypothetical protein
VAVLGGVGGAPRPAPPLPIGVSVVEVVVDPGVVVVSAAAADGNRPASATSRTAGRA